MTVPIVHLADVSPQPRPAEYAPPSGDAGPFQARLARLAPQLGLQQLGCGLVVVAPGKRAFPFHGHRVNDELFYVLEGSGTLRLGDQTHPVRAGDLIGCPPGGPESAHQLINTGATDLRYLAISTKRSPEICDYPDSGKFAIYTEGDPATAFYFMGRESSLVDYWDGE